MTTTTTTTTPINKQALTKNLPYTLHDTEGNPLGQRKAKFVEQEIAAGRTTLVFLIGEDEMREERLCTKKFCIFQVHYHQ